MKMPRVQVETLPSPSAEAFPGLATSLTPTLKTPAAAHESFLRRPELSPTEAPHLQAHTSALISKVETEIFPRLKNQQAAIESENSKNNNSNGRVAFFNKEQENEKEDAAAVGLMQNLRLCDESTYTSGVVKELDNAKECLSRAETMLLVQRKAHDKTVEEHHDVRSLLQHAGTLLHQAQDELLKMS